MKDLSVDIVGHKVVEIRGLTRKELEAEGWEGYEDQGNSYFGNSNLMALVLDNGTVLYASQDEEGNGPGELFGRDSQGNEFLVGDMVE